MPNIIHELRTIKLTLDPDGRLWSLPGHGRAKLAGDEPDWQLPPGSSVRVPGLRRNLRLIMNLYNMVRAGQVRGLEVCSPWCCGPEAHLARADVLLSAAKGFDAPISAGGWRTFDRQDARAVVFAVPATRTPPVPFDHPAGVYFGWPSRLSDHNLSKLLGEIVDPRWFIDPGDPDRSNKLSNYLGLNADRRGVGSQARRRERCRLVLDCWKTRPYPLPDALGPDRFLWRLWYRLGGHREDQNTISRADMVVSRKLVSYIRQVWLMSVCRGGLASELFVPNLFFRETDEVQAFVSYRRRHG